MGFNICKKGKGRRTIFENGETVVDTYMIFKGDYFI